MKISIIIPVYNNATGIRLLLDALLDQSFTDFEIIIADNNSQDDILSKINQVREKTDISIKIVNVVDVQSSYVARNKGLSIAKGDVIAFIDSDCVPSKKWLEYGYKELASNNVTMVAGAIHFTFEQKEPNIWEYYDALGKLNQKEYVKLGFGATANLFVSKTVFDKHGAFNQELQSGGDYEFGMRATGNRELIAFSKDAIVYHPARTSFNSKLKKSIRVARGQKKLTRMGLLKHGQITYLSFVPIRSIRQSDEYKLSFVVKVKLLIIVNFFRYLNLLIRIF